MLTTSCSKSVGNNFFKIAFNFDEWRLKLINELRSLWAYGSNMFEIPIFLYFLNLLIKNYASDREISAEATKVLRSLVAWILFVYIPECGSSVVLGMLKIIPRQLGDSMTNSHGGDSILNWILSKKSRWKTFWKFIPVAHHEETAPLDDGISRQKRLQENS